LTNEFVIQLTGSTDLNFLVYIQNDFLNRNQKMDRPKFPLLDGSLTYKDTFKADFKEAWESAVQREQLIAHKKELTRNDLPLAETDLHWFYDRLVDASVPYESFHFFYRAFATWWDGLAGRFSIERGLGEELQSIYLELIEIMNDKSLSPEKELQLRFIYDDVVLADNHMADYFAVLSIEWFFTERNALLSKLTSLVQ